MERELTYKVPFERLTKLSRSAGRRSYRTVWRLGWLIAAAYVSAIAAIVYWGPGINQKMVAAGIPYAVEALFLAAVVLACLALFGLRRLWRSQIRERADFDQEIRLTACECGLRLATDQIEYLLKWNGISQMLLEDDGIVVSHGNLFFLIPNSAFANDGERLQFIHEVYSRLGERAKALSKEHMRNVV